MSQHLSQEEPVPWVNCLLAFRRGFGQLEGRYWMFELDRRSLLVNQFRLLVSLYTHTKTACTR